MASHEPPSYDHRATHGSQTVSDLVEITAENFDDAVTEVKPVISATVRLPKEQGGELTEAVTAFLSTLDWIRDVTSVDTTDVVENGGTLVVTGEFAVTMHFPADVVDDAHDVALAAVETVTDKCDTVTAVTDVTLRLPPYRLRAY